MTTRTVKYRVCHHKYHTRGFYLVGKGVLVVVDLAGVRELKRLCKMRIGLFRILIMHGLPLEH